MEVYNTITDVSPFVWDKIVPADKAFMGTPYLAAFEKSISGNIGFRYLVLYKNNQPVGVIVGQIITFDGANIGLDEGEANAPFFKKLLTRIVNQFSLRLFIVGNAFMTGEYGLWFSDPEMNDDERSQLLQYGLNTLVRQERKGKGLSGIVLKEFFIGHEGVLKPLIECGYLEFMVQPDMIMDMRPEWVKFDDYLEAMSSKYRVRARKALKMMAGIETRVMDAAEIDRQMPVMEALYEQIIGNASFKFAKFELQHIPLLKRSLNDGLTCLGFYKDGQLVGFISLYDNEQDEVVAGMMGMDKGLQKQHDLYLNILYTIVRYTIEHGRRKLVMGRTAMEIKSSLGAKPHDMLVYSRLLSRPLNWLVKPVIKRLTRTKPWQLRDPFK